MTEQACELGREAGTGIAVELPFVAPYDWDGIRAFLAPRAIPGVERVERGRYLRTVALGNATGMVEVAPDGPGHLRAVIRLSDPSQLPAAVARLRRLFDLDAPVPEIAAHLAADPRLALSAAARPGLRVPGAWDGFELAVRAILGQQVSVRAATTLVGRLVAAHGEPVPGGPAAGIPGLLFPAARVLAGADLTGIGLTRARAAAVSAFAAALVGDRDLLQATGTLDEAVERLCRLPGIGPWTAHYIAMRALRQPDAFPASDLGLRRAVAGPGGPPTPAALAAAAEAWRPWRAYAALHLWTAGMPQREDKG